MRIFPSLKKRMSQGPAVHSLSLRSIVLLFSAMQEI